jgi:DNA-binding beta-propeller fold protein YncE
MSLPLALSLLLAAGGVQAEIFISANDGKQARADDVTFPDPDSISVIDVTGSRVRLLASATVTNTLTGPPTAVAVTRDGRMAIVTSSQKLNGRQLVNDDLVSLVDISVPSNPRLVQTERAGPAVAGVAVSPNNRLVLVASSGDETVTVYRLENRRLVRRSLLVFTRGMGPADVMFTRDGRTALVTGRYNSDIALLAVNGDSVTDTGRRFQGGRGPYANAITPDGKYIISGNLQGVMPPGGAPSNSPFLAPAAGRGGRGPGAGAPGAGAGRGAPAAAPVGRGAAAAAPGAGGGAGRGGPPARRTISLTEIATGRVAAQLEVAGQTPEHVALSTDGKLAAVVIQNGSGNLIRTSPNFATTSGILEVFAVGDGTLTKLDQASIGHWPQGAAISADGRTILAQNGYERTIQVFRMEGGKLVEDKASMLTLGARPGSIATARSR